MNRARERSRARAGNAVYNGTNGNLSVEARVFLEFKEGEDDFYVEVS